ncbi:MAG: 2-dehydropantoate 2-reductase N-terminal domain-containing protein [Hyphomicrobiales bacterium]
MRATPMKILVIGAGIIGTLYGARLSMRGHDVEILARGRRLGELSEHGVIIEDIVSGARDLAPARAVAAPSAEAYDLVAIAVRDRQIDSVLPVVEALAGRPDILFLVNCPLRVGDLVDRLGGERTFFGFSGAGGVHDGATVRYAAVSDQPTSFGPVRGADPARPAVLAGIFADAGFATAIVADMEAWLMCHAAFIVALCGALYRSGGRSAALAASPGNLSALARGTREGFAAVAALGFTPSPPKLRLAVRFLPDGIIAAILRRFFASELAEFAVDGHANAAPDDMADLAADCRIILDRAGAPAPVLRSLCDEVERFAAQAASSAALSSAETSPAG